MPTNWKQLKAIEQKNKERILAVCPQATENSGIYAFLRVDENGFKYAYIGKATHLLTRLSQHLAGYKQWIDLSLKKHGLFSAGNMYGWDVKILEQCSVDYLDIVEPLYIKEWAEKGYQLRNVESGGTTGKTDINERKPSRGYRDGIKQGYENARREVKHWFDKHLMFDTKDLKPTQHAIRAFEKFTQFLQGENDND